MEKRFSILAGPSMSGKTYKLCSDILKAAHDNPKDKFIIVIPEQAGNAYEKKLIDMNRKMYGRSGFMNIDIIGFGRLSYRIFDDMGVNELSVLEEYEKNMLVRVVAGRISDKLSVYGSSVDKMGFISKMKSLISELIQYSVTPEDLDKVIKELNVSPGNALAAKLSDVRLLYQEFLNSTQDMNIGVSEERMKLLTRILRSDKACGVVDNAFLCFDEFRGYTPDQLAVIGALSKRAKHIRFGLCIETEIIKNNNPVKEHDIFYQSWVTYRSLLETVGYQPDIIYMNRNPERNNMLAHLEKNVFRFPIKEFSGTDDSLKIFSSMNPEEEIRYVAQCIRSEVKSGLRYKDIVVVTGDIEGLDNYAGNIFDEYDIPVFFDYNRKLRKNPYTESILRLFDIASRDFDYNGVFGFVKTGVMEIEDGHSLDNLENHILKTGIRGHNLWDKKMRPYGRKVTEEQKEKYHKMDIIREQIVETVKPITELSTGKHEVRLYIEALRTIMENLGYQDKMIQSASYLEGYGLMAEARVMRSLYGILDRLLKQTEDMLGEEQMTISEISEILESGINEITIGVIPPTIDSVHICDMARSRIIDAKVVHFINVNDGIIPVNKSSGSILSEKDKEAVCSILTNLGTGKKLADFGTTQSMNEMFMIYQILSKPSDKLTISYSQSDLEGKEMQPSFILGRIGRMFPAMNTSLEKITAFEGTDRSDRAQYISWLREMLEEIHVLSNDKEYSDRFEQDKENVIRYLSFEESEELECGSLILPALDFNNQAELIPDQTMRNLDIKLSISKMESYSRCPYSFFMNYILGLKERPEKKIETYDVGNIVHRALELTTIQVREEYGNDWKSLEDSTIEQLTESSFEKSWEEYDIQEDGEVTGKLQFIKDNMRELSKKTALTLRSHIVSGEMLPERAEQGFTAEFTARRPDGTEVPVTILGKVDRIDTFEEKGKLYVRVIDYKTGNHSFLPADIRDGLDIQLTVYTKIILDILKKKYKESEVIPAGMYFYHVANPVISMASDAAIKKADGDIVRANQLQYEKEMKLKGVSNLDPVLSSESELSDDKTDIYSHRMLNLHDRTLVSPETGAIIGQSIVVPVSGNKEGTLTETSVVAGTDTLNGVCDYSVNLMHSTADRILSGCFEKSPAQSTGGADSPCKYCNFTAVCRFNAASGSARIKKKGEGSNSHQLEDLAEAGRLSEKTELSKEQFQS